MGFPVAIQTRFGTLSAALRTNYTARSKRDRVETGRNMPGTSGKCPSTFNYATACRTSVPVVGEARGIAQRVGCRCKLSVCIVGKGCGVV